MTITQCLAAVVLTAALSTQANAQTTPNTNTPRVDRREANQAARIEKGVQKGKITPAEQAKLEAQQRRIQTAEEKAKSDNKVTVGERAKLNHMENRSNRNIRRKTYNGSKVH